MVAGVVVGSVSGDMAGPAEQTAHTSPQTRRNDEPEDTSQDATVVELPKVPGLARSKPPLTQDCVSSFITSRICL